MSTEAKNIQKIESIDGVKSKVMADIAKLEETFKHNLALMREYQDEIAKLDASCKEIRGAIVGLSDLLRSINGGDIIETGDNSQTEADNNEG